VGKITTYSVLPCEYSRNYYNDKNAIKYFTPGYKKGEIDRDVVEK
jgi:hypothetical protein